MNNDLFFYRVIEIASTPSCTLLHSKVLDCVRAREPFFYAWQIIFITGSRFCNCNLCYGRGSNVEQVYLELCLRFAIEHINAINAVEEG